jgi:cytidine deaminase
MSYLFPSTSPDGWWASRHDDPLTRIIGPYSNFRVGSSILLSNGSYHTGANVEACVPVTICAERCAIVALVASMKRPAMPTMRALAVASDISPPASPCGMCRQMIYEFAPNKDLPIYMYGSDGLDGKVVKMTIGELLPMGFGPNDLDKPRKGSGNGTAPAKL